MNCTRWCVILCCLEVFFVLWTQRALVKLTWKNERGEGAALGLQLNVHFQPIFKICPHGDYKSVYDNSAKEENANAQKIWKNVDVTNRECCLLI